MICKLCNHDKPNDTFGTYMVGKHGPYRRKQCKECVSKRDKAWREENAAWVKERDKQYWAEHREEYLAKKKRHWQRHRAKNLARCKANYQKNKIARREQSKQWHEANKDKVVAYSKEYRRKNWAKILAQKNHDKQAYRSTPKGHIHSAMSCYIYQALRDKKAGRKWETLVGYSVHDLMAHLESQFQLGMTWENYGQWHIDHIRPVASFSFVGPEDRAFKECWALSNLRPLWAAENIRKGNKWAASAA